MTSLYSSFLFVALLLLVLGLVFSARGREKLWPVVGPLGAILLTALSSQFALQGDQLGVLQAVLDTNFWLSTHVVAISTGYTGALATGLIGHAWLIRKIVRPSDEQGLAQTEKMLSRMLLAALLFTFLGTILGGIWADQSWGRFWGWDPKENGALLILIWMAVLQHARLARLIDAQGLAVGSIFLVMVVLFSWLGVNLMGVGLHSYGWTQGVGAILLAVAAFETVFMVLGSVAARMRGPPMEGLRAMRVQSIRRETADAVTVRLAAAGSDRIVGEPGRFLTLFARIDGVAYRRAYSLSSVSPTGRHAEITVKRVEGGRVSSWIVDHLRPGARLTVGGPSGRFGLAGYGNGNGAGHAHGGPGAVFVASGSGIAPLAPMAEQLLRTGAPLLLLYASRDEKSIIFRERLDSLARAYPRLTVRHVLSDPSSSWKGDRGWIDGQLVLRAAPPRAGREFYLCGPAEMVDSVREALAAGGVPDAVIHQERFLPGSSGSARRASRGAVVRFRRSGREVRVLPGQSILEAGLRAGLNLPYGCAAGQCRECAARLADGRLTMEETSPLSSAERANGVVLTCVSYPDGDCALDL